MKNVFNIIRFLSIALVIAIIAFVIWIQGQYVVPVLMYHHVKESRIRELNTVTPEAFEKQMAYLSRHGYKVLSMDDYISVKKSGGKFSRNTIVITFDDGYEDNYTYAFPILKKYHLPATIFVISDYVGQEPFVNWNQIKEMMDEKIIIGSHTRHHRYLPNVMDEELENQIAGSKKFLEKRLGKTVNYIAYPTGGFTDEVKSMAKAAGYLAGFTTNRGQDKTAQDLFELKRIRMNNKDNSTTLFAKFSGYYNVFRSKKESHTEDDLGSVYKR